MKCVIVAAGQGVRLRGKLELKPLVQVHGVALVEHVIGRARYAGIDEFVVVSGYRGDELRSSLDEFSARNAVRITHVINEDWARGNGVSLLKAKPHLGEPFLLTMCDHLVDPGILRDLAAGSMSGDGVILAVDYNTRNTLADLEDVTRVKCNGVEIVRVGKLMQDFDGFDTGVFLCRPVIFDALQQSQSLGDDSITGAMNVLATWRKAMAFDVGARLWIDVDDPAALQLAEHLLSSGQL